LVWRALGNSPRPLKVFVHLYGPDNTVDIFAQRDGEPLAGAAPTNTWVAGEYLEDDYLVDLPPGLAPGRYRLGLGLYDPELLQRLPVGTADHIILTEIEILR
jgi:hypothetical protein